MDDALWRQQLHADACLHVDLVVALATLLLDLVQIVLDDHGLQNSASVLEVRVEAELVTEDDHGFSFLDETSSQVELLLRGTLDVEQLVNVLVKHEDLGVSAGAAGLHQHTMPVVISVILVEVLLQEVFHTRGGDSTDEHNVWNVSLLLVLETSVTTLCVEELDHSGTGLREVNNHESNHETKKDPSLW